LGQLKNLVPLLLLKKLFLHRILRGVEFNFSNEAVIISELFSVKRLTSVFGYAKLVIALRAFFFMQKINLFET